MDNMGYVGQTFRKKFNMELFVKDHNFVVVKQIIKKIKSKPMNPGKT